MSELLLVINGFHLLYLSPWNIVLLYIFATFTLFCGFWGSMQFTSFTHRFPVVLLNAERITMAVFPLVFYAILVWGLIGLVGPEATPFYLVAVSLVFFRTYATPIPSSFRYHTQTSHEVTKGYSYEAGFILDAPELAIHFLVYTFAPALVFLILNWAFLADPRVLSALLFLLSFPLLLIVVHSPKEWFWWSGLSDDGLATFKRVLTIISLVIAAGVFEYRVIFLSYGSYIAFPWPMNVILVTVAVYAAAFLGISLYSGSLLSLVNYPLGMAVATGTAAISSLVLGLPVYVGVLLVAAAACFVHFYFHHRLEAYLVFLGCISLAALYFLYENFFFLHFHFVEFNVSLKLLSMLVLLLLVSSLAVIPATFLPVPPPVVSFVVQPIVVAQAVVLCMVEQILHEEHEDMYPGYLVLLTTAVGLLVARELGGSKKISPTGVWLLTTLYLSKLALFLTPLPLAVPSTMVLLLPVLRINFFTPTSPRMTVREGLIHFTAVGLAAFITRRSLPQRLVALFLHKQPSESLIFASFLLVWGLGSLSLSYRHFAHLDTPKKGILLLLVTGGLLALLQPEVDPMEVSSSFQRTFGGGSSLGGTRLQYLSHGDLRWTSWPFIAGFLANALLLILGSKATMARPFWRLFQVTASATCAALFIGGTFIPFSSTFPPLYLGYSVAAFLFFLNLSFLLLPVGATPKILCLT